MTGIPPDENAEYKTGLKPCPFCGGKPRYKKLQLGGAVIECIHCDIFLGQVLGDDVVKAWNRRVDE